MPVQTMHGVVLTCKAECHIITSEQISKTMDVWYPTLNLDPVQILIQTLKELIHVAICKQLAVYKQCTRETIDCLSNSLDVKFGCLCKFFDLVLMCQRLEFKMLVVMKSPLTWIEPQKRPYWRCPLMLHALKQWFQTIVLPICLQLPFCTRP